MKKLALIFAAVGLAAVLSIAVAACGGGGGTSSGAEGKQGGTLNITYASFPESMDPAIAYSAEGWTAMGEVYIPLLTYKHAEGIEGGEVVPGLAKEMPKVSNGGKTYTLFLRPGLKFSDGKPVKASDFAFAVERMIKLNSPGSPFYLSIVGAEEFAKTKKGGISGIKTNDETGEIQIELEKPRGTFTNELAMPFVAPLPPGTPIEDLTADPPPGTGPYMITEVRANRGWSYARNPYWAKANSAAMPEYPSGHVDAAKVTIIHNAQTQVSDVEQNKFQWMENQVPPDSLPRVKEKYEGTQLRMQETNSTYFFWMNTESPTFKDVRVRQAVNYAIDPAALERIYAGTLSATQQILPPGMPGYEHFELYPHNMAKAKELIKEANPADRNITVWTDDEPENKEAGEYYNDVLQQLGFHTTLKVLSGDAYFSVVPNRSTPNLDTGWSDWFQDYPHPNDFFQPLLAGESIMPVHNQNWSNINVPELNEEITKLGEEVLGPEQEEAYAELDRKYMELAPWAPYGTRTLTTFVSSAINLDGVIFNPTLGQFLTSFEFKE